MINKVLLALLIATTAACSSDPVGPLGPAGALAQEEDPGRGIVCKFDAPTQAAAEEKRCTTPQEREDARQRAEKDRADAPRAASDGP